MEDLEKTIKNLQSDLAEAQRKILVLERMRFEKIKKDTLSSDDDSSELLAAGVAHEFNNILGALSGHADWALESGGQAEMREALEMCQGACGRAFEITRSLQQFSQPREEKRSLFNTIKLAEELQTLTSKFGVPMTIKFGNISIYGVYTEILEILLNLFYNAIDAMADQKEKSVLVEAKKLDAFSLRITFSDNGPGVPQTLVSEIFRPFFTTKGVLKSMQDDQSKVSTAQQGGGGLGLYLCRRYAAEHGGQLTLFSNEAGKCTFALDLPIADEESSTS